MASSSRLGVQLLTFPFARSTNQRSLGSLGHICARKYAARASTRTSSKDEPSSVVESSIPPKKTRIRKSPSLAKDGSKPIGEVPKRAQASSNAGEAISKAEECEVQAPKKTRGKGRKKAVSIGGDGQETRSRGRPAITVLSPEKMDTFAIDSDGPFSHLPKRSDWSNAFASKFQYDTAYRFLVANEDTIESIISAMNLKSRRKAAGRKLTVIEAYPGPGLLTRRLLQDKNVENVIALEDHPGFYPWLEVSAELPSMNLVASLLIRNVQKLTSRN